MPQLMQNAFLLSQFAEAAKLSIGRIKQVNNIPATDDDNFQTYVLGKEGVTVVRFWATLCPPELHPISTGQSA